MLLHPRQQVGLDLLEMTDAILSKAEVIMATRAPAIIALSTSWPVWTPPVTASSPGNVVPNLLRPVWAVEQKRGTGLGGL